MILEIEGLETGYGKLRVLSCVSLSIGAESVGLFGPNGAGKTTLINTIMGMNRVWKGSLRFEGRDIGGLPTHEVARAGIALVPQERELFPLMSVADNLELGAAFIPHAVSRKEELLEQ
ncbi:MAG: ATP-binding cassette domain-containing protein, partial [Spirochaetota bacterium]